MGSVAFCCAECGRIFAERENQALRSYGDKWFFDRSWCGACVQKGVAFWPTTFLNSSERELGFLPIEILAEEFLINSGAPLNVN